MELNVNVDADAINKMVSDAILKSTLGDAVKKAIDTQLANLTRSYDNPLESVIRMHVADMVREVLRTEHQEALRQRLVAALAEKLSDEFIDRVCEKAADRFA